MQFLIGMKGSEITIEETEDFKAVLFFGMRVFVITVDSSGAEHLQELTENNTHSRYVPIKHRQRKRWNRYQHRRL